MKRLFLISASFIVISSVWAQSRCVTAPVSMTGDQVTLTSSGEKKVTNDQAYIYYSRRHHRHMEDVTINGISEKYHSVPLMLSSKQTVNTMPESYTVTLSAPQNNVTVCPDSTLNLTANISLEKVASYTGNYPGTDSDTKEYTKVSKREYRMVARKMRKIRHNEERIALRTCSKVEVSNEQPM